MLYAIVAVIILIIDQATKYWISANIAADSASPLIPGFIQLTNVHNTGAAFGILKDARWFFIILTLIVTIGIIVLLAKNIVKGKLGRWMLVLVVAGGLGNCIDRLINGYVVDMFQFQFMNFAVFNVADIFITVCGIIFCIYLVVQKEPEEEPAPVPQKVPTRPMPKAGERPVRTDYISQLKKPVVEGRRNIEAELSAKNAEAAPARNVESSFTDWSIPDFDASAKKAPEAAPVPAPKQEAAAPAKPKPQAAGLDALLKEPARPAKKSESDFDLEDILAEFRDK